MPTLGGECFSSLRSFSLRLSFLFRRHMTLAVAAPSFCQSINQSIIISLRLKSLGFHPWASCPLLLQDHHSIRWLLMDNRDPVEELQWLVDTLSAAEAAGEAVHILGHIPPGGGDCDHTWSHIFNNIVFRYESTIRGLFFGHTHGDSFSVFYDQDNYTRPVAVAFISPSGTTGTSHHPAFKVFEVDAGHDDATWVVVDAAAYYMNLTEANMEGGSAVYNVRYSTKDSYGVPSMTPASMHQLVLNMVIEEGLYERHIWNINNNMAEVPLAGSCNATCLKNELCGLVSSDSSDSTACQNLQDYIDSVTP